MTCGPQPVTAYKVARFASFADYSFRCLHLTPPPLRVVPWSRTWRITAPEFADDPPSSPTAVASERPQAPVFSSFGECAAALLGISRPPPPIHVSWSVQTPITVRPLPANIQESMAFQFVDPRLFLPEGAQRIMVPGRPLMKRVVTGHIHKQNNDLAIATFNPLPQHQLDFNLIHATISDFLNVHAIPFETIQKCPFGQAYVKFTYQRDLLIQNSPLLLEMAPSLSFHMIERGIIDQLS